MSSIKKMKVTTLKGIFPDPKPVKRKNFIQENVKNLRRMEQCFQANKEVEKLQKLQLHKHYKDKKKYYNIPPKVVTSFYEKKKHDNSNINQLSMNKEETDKQVQNESNMFEYNKSQAACTNKIIEHGLKNNISGKQKNMDKYKNQQKLQSKISSKQNVIHECDNTTNILNTQNTITYKSQGIQTLDTDQLKDIYSEGFIRYPSKNITKFKTMDNGDLNNQEEVLRKQFDSPTDKGDMRNTEELQKVELRKPLVSKEEINFIKLNKERIPVVNKLMTQLNNDMPPPNYRKGVVPKYLQNKKEAQEKEQKAKMEALQSECQEGYIPLPEHERKETLELLKKNYQDYVNELNMMPIKTDTLRIHKRKIEIEKQLNKLEEGIKIFSRQKVYVKINT